MFMTKSKYHKKPRSRLIQHIIQVNDYKDYLESDEYLSAIIGYVPKKIKYNLLIGRNDNRDENIHHLNKSMRQLGQKHLNLITYDDLMDYQVKFLNRMELLEIS